MTLLSTRPPEAGRHASPAGPGGPPRPAGGGRGPIPVAVGAAMCWLAVLILGFGGYLFAVSSLQQGRAQSNLYKTFRKQLGEATAPTGPTHPGAPVAILDIPAIGVHRQVVVEGTSAADLTHGPGHRVDTPLPGQAGVAAVYARRSTFGAPFAHLTRLRYGDRITVTTGYGAAVYTVAAAGDASHPITDTAANRLLLITADSTVHPRHVLTISADLTGNPVPAAAGYPALPPTERALASDAGALQPLMMWGLALVLAVGCWTVARQRWSRRASYLVGLPVLVAVTWNVYENAAQLLPNIF